MRDPLQGAPITALFKRSARWGGAGEWTVTLTVPELKIEWLNMLN